MTLGSCLVRDVPPPVDELAVDERFPSGASRLLALHRCHESELRAMARGFPLRSGARVADIACGDGTWAMVLARRGARVEGLAATPAFVEMAEHRAQRAGLEISFRRGSSWSLPFATSELDGAFCGQNLHTLPDPERALEEMCRVVKPGGWVGVIEQDALQCLVLPWPPHAELTLRAADFEVRLTGCGGARPPGSGAREPSSLSVECRLGRALARAGFSCVRQRRYATHRRAPLAAGERSYLEKYLEELLGVASAPLDVHSQRELRRLTRKGTRDYLLDQPGLRVTYVDWIALGSVQPDTRSGR